MVERGVSVDHSTVTGPRTRAATPLTIGYLHQRKNDRGTFHMIYVDRTSVQNPFEDPSLAKATADELARARSFYSESPAQRRFEFKVYRHAAVKGALNALFHRKCAYCESPLVSAVGDIEQFRPKGGVSEAKAHPGYWWLASSWGNLLISCQYCNRISRAEPGEGGHSEAIGKHNRFPLIDERYRAYSPGSDISLEQPLLLDPTVDDPAHHLAFSDDGHVYSETERGNATISILGLNRRNLVEQRRRTAGQYSLAFGFIRSSLEKGLTPPQQVFDQLRRMTAGEADYAGMVRQLFQRDQGRLEKDARAILQAHGEGDAGTQPIGPARGQEEAGATPARVKRAAFTTKAYRERMANYSLADEEGVKRYKSQRRSIETISIRNIRAIEKFDVDLADLGNGAGRWLMLLGENGTGKSTVLQMIALVLGGSDYVSTLLKEERLSLEDLVRSQCRSGEIGVKVSGFDAPHRLKVFKDRLEFISPTREVAAITPDGKVNGTGWPPQTVMAGYGATRLLPRRASNVSAGGAFARVDNLFDPFVSLIDAQVWLSGLAKRDFDRTAIVLKDLLALDPEAKLYRSRGRISVDISGVRVSLSSLSVGYQTVVAATADMLEILSRVWTDPLEAEGIVLIDELDAHLHPTWQMQIVNSLRRALPAVQFITTTHQPLCLRGLAEGEVVVMRRDENREIEVIADLPSPADFRVDQLLTSPFFGLNSTTDPDTELLFDRYYALLSLKERGEEDEHELAELTGKLETRKQFGETQREGLYLEAIDRLLARRKAMPMIPHEAVREEAVNEISAIWDRLVADVPLNGEKPE